MSTRTKAKTRGANLAVPQTREQAAGYVAEIGALQREIARAQADMNDEIARIKEDAESRAEPLRERAKALTEGLKTWCEANRAVLTGNGAVKHADLGTGIIRWRMRPPRVSLPRDVAGLIEHIKSMGFVRFLRVTEEPSKEAMLAEPDVARVLPGVRICSAGEDFVVEPFEAEIAK
ncbi:host-nuclease inhibitor Gam family protein [Blastochloris tepida]|uniref:Host-nuclease inhibitor protein Gam n=1 Tax=Blastochloris tepida TaxID=2233851 RepID=A0A348FYK5_9HYPH|nr:host-nuclease inhibitor Gam family protein [Blastochloris tepida]BBF92388.1 host-nuclease inhibitor protein Gam [Blastochloris tepida]